MAETVEIVEVSPRDGIQNESKILDTATKLELISRAIDAGIRRFEATSFVNPKRVPQMADADAVAAGLPKSGGSVFQGLVLNARGFDRAADAGLHEANVVVVASETFSEKNQGTSTAGTIQSLAHATEHAQGRIQVGVTIAAAFGCPFEGEMPLSHLMQVVENCMVYHPFELALADTIGVATPRDIQERVAAVKAAFPDVRIRLHLHNTRNTGIANAWAGIEAGVHTLDSSLGGVGGCPFAPRATGNIATEDLVYMLDRAGIQTGIDLDKAIDTATWLETKLEKTVPGMVMKAGGFPAGSLAA